MTAAGIHAHPTRKLGLIRSDSAALAKVIELPAIGRVDGLPVPPDVDHLFRVQPLMVMGANNRFGTCWPTSMANLAIMTRFWVDGTRVTVTDDDVFALYRQAGNPDFDPVTGAGDKGCDPTVGLAALAQHGLTVTHLTPDGDPDPQSREVMTPVCYAQVLRQQDLHMVTAAAGGASMCLDLETAQQGQTEARPPIWDYSNSPQWGGHAVMGGAYGPNPLAAQEIVETWQTQVGTTRIFLARQLEAVFVVVWRELWAHDPFMANVNRTALAAAYYDATGQNLSAPDWP